MRNNAQRSYGLINGCIPYAIKSIVDKSDVHSVDMDDLKRKVEACNKDDATERAASIRALTELIDASAKVPTIPSSEDKQPKQTEAVQFFDDWIKVWNTYFVNCNSKSMFDEALYPSFHKFASYYFDKVTVGWTIILTIYMIIIHVIMTVLVITHSCTRSLTHSLFH